MEELAAHEELLRGIQVDYGEFVQELKRKYSSILRVAETPGTYDSHGDPRTAESEFLKQLLEDIQYSLSVGETSEEAQAGCRKRAEELIQAFQHSGVRVEKQ